MNSVANQMVATLMNSNFSALQSSSRKPFVPSRDFSKVYGQVRKVQVQSDDTPIRENNGLERRQNHHDTLHDKVMNETRDMTETTQTGATSETEEVKETDVNTTQVNNERPVEEVEQELKEVSEIMEEEVVSLKPTMDDEESLASMEETMLAISELFNIPVEMLDKIMDQLDFEVVDLADMGNLIQLVQEIFGLEDVGSLILNQEATQLIKEVKVEVEKLIEELGIDLPTFRSQLLAEREASEQGQKTLVPTQDPVGHELHKEADKTDGVKLEVVDMRDAQNTTKYSQKDTNNPDQGSSKFSELIGQNITLTKEVVVQNTVNEVKYQQISTREVIDQIVTKAVVKFTNGSTSMHLQLNPGHLGKVAVSITAEQGMVKGQFVAENRVVKEMLESNLIQLKTQLEQQGIKVDKIEVTVGNANQYFNQKNQEHQEHASSKRSHRRRLGGVTSITEVGELEEVQQRPHKTMPSELDVHTVEYSA